MNRRCGSRSGSPWLAPPDTQCLESANPLLGQRALPLRLASSAEPHPQYLPCGIGIILRDIHVSTRVLDLLKCSTVRIEGIIQHAQSVAASAGEYLSETLRVVLDVARHPDQDDQVR